MEGVHAGSSVLFGDGSEVAVNLLLGEASEALPLLANDANLDVAGLEVHTEHCLQATDGLLDGLCFGQLQVLLLQNLFEGIDRLLILGASRTSLVAHEHASWVDLEQGRTLLLVHAVEHGAHPVRPHVSVLSVDLSNVGQLQSKVVHRHFVAVRVFELVGNFSCPIDQCSCIWGHACHQTADVGSDVEQVGHEVLVHQLVRNLLLSNADDAVLSSESHRGDVLVLLHGLVSILDLMQPSLRGEDGDVSVISRCSRHGWLAD
mmetsp:Transcript_24368/g.36994  ORF Transcript_24368/g.36994 Transcript_24368/m.36994 type:complete len:261 (+) Transcript_24368:1010-1792(+)